MAAIYHIEDSSIEWLSREVYRTLALLQPIVDSDYGSREPVRLAYDRACQAFIEFRDKLRSDRLMQCGRDGEGPACGH